MDRFEEALRNIDVFCKVFVRKLLEEGFDENNSIDVEPMDKLLKRKIKEERIEAKMPLIPLPHIEEPLIDVFEEESMVKVFMQCRCFNQNIVVSRQSGNIQICIENECWMVKLPTERLRIEELSIRCNSNNALEIAIPKN